MRSYFVKVLNGHIERLNNTGWPEEDITYIKQELDFHEDGLSGFDEISDQMLDLNFVDSFRTFAGLDKADWTDNEIDLRRELRKGRRDQIKAFLSHAESLEGYSLTKPVEPSPKRPETASVSLGQALDDFLSEHSHQWSSEMQKKAQSYLSVLAEYFGSNRDLSEITKMDAAELKKVLIAMPANRNTKQETRDLPLLEAIKVSKLKKISAKTADSYIDTFRRFFDWAERHGYTSLKLFDRMKLGKAKRSAIGRRAYTSEETQTLYGELTAQHSVLVKKHDHKWGALLGLFTGARLREISQLNKSDIRQEDNIWFIDINDDGENKSLKTPAAKRRVPIHSELIRLGFLDFVGGRRDDQRLFQSFSYNVKEGYGRNLGRWFNNVLLPGLELKEDGLVFHSLRHTMVTRLAQAGVPEPLYQEIVGHERQGVAQQVYFKEGHTLAQKQEAIEKFEV